MSSETQCITTSSSAIVLYNPPQTPEEFLQSEVEKITAQVYSRVMEQEKAAQRLLSPDLIPRSSITIKLRCLLNEMTKLYQDGFLDGEFLVARGAAVLLDLRSHKVCEVAAVTAGDPQFMIGSVSKQFFAVALLKALYDHVAVGSSDVSKTADIKRLLSLPLSHFLSSEAVLWSGAMSDWADEVTLHHLLSHTSGIPNYTEIDEYFAEDGTGRKLCEIPHSIGEVLKIVSKYPLNFIPGSKFSYSNTGYCLIAEVIKAITGIPAAHYVREALFDPLEMSSTSNPETGNEVQLRELDPHCTRLVPQRSYDPSGDREPLPPEFLEDMSWTQGDGSIISTTSDLLKWNIALHQRRSVLPNLLYELFITENKDGYAYGICRGEFHGGIVLDHGGKVGSYTSNLFYFPDDEISIIQLSHVKWTPLSRLIFQ